MKQDWQQLSILLATKIQQYHLVKIYNMQGSLQTKKNRIVRHVKLKNLHHSYNIQCKHIVLSRKKNLQKS